LALTGKSIMIQNIAHRGASAYEPENTLRAFELALAMEATMIEVDIHLSADGHPVVMHDAQLCRTTNGQGKIDDCGAKIFHHIIKGELLKPLFDYKLFFLVFW